MRLPALHGSETFAAIHGAVFPGLEGHLGGLAAVRADGVVHFAGSAVVAGCLVGLTALTAAGGLVLETLFSVEFLFASSKHEFIAAVTAHQRFVLIHCFCDPLMNIVDLIGCG